MVFRRNLHWVRKLGSDPKRYRSRGLETARSVTSKICWTHLLTEHAGLYKLSYMYKPHSLDSFGLLGQFEVSNQLQLLAAKLSPVVISHIVHYHPVFALFLYPLKIHVVRLAEFLGHLYPRITKSRQRHSQYNRKGPACFLLILAKLLPTYLSKHILEDSIRTISNIIWREQF